MRNAKTLGLALVAMFSISAVMAVGASADEFTAEKYPVTLTGESEEGFSDEVGTTAGTMKCPKPTYQGTVSAGTDIRTISVTPDAHDQACTAFGFPGTVDVNECKYVFHINTVGTEGSVDFECPAGKEITMTATSAGTAKCTVHIPTQTKIPGTVKYSNTLSGGTIDLNLTGLKYTHTGGTGVGACAAGSGTGTLKARAVITGEEDSAPYNKINIFMSS